jgi:2-polyprenyl-3-methyl-5-hydroxy-6-metoxy-1,4-benzoquinol methylase
MDLRELIEVEYRDEPEMLEHPEGIPREDIVGALAPIEWVNRWCGGRRVLLRHVVPMVRRAHEAITRRDEAAGGSAAAGGGMFLGGGRGERRRGDDLQPAGVRPVTIFDIGTGGGDLPRAIVDACRALRIPVRVRAIDINRDVVSCASERSPGYPEVSFGVADIFAHPAEPESFDVVTASLFLHHFSPERCVALFNLMGRLARYGLVVNDLIRHPVALLGAKAIAGCVRNPVFRHDAVVSVRRAFTVEEWADIARRTVLPDIRLWTHAPCRVAVTWERLVVSAREPRTAREGGVLLDPELVTPAPVPHGAAW